MMRLKEFDYHLPQHLIAQFPLKTREDARLLVVERKTAKILHDHFRNIDRYLPEKSHLVFNNSRVVPARLIGRRQTGAKVEIFLLKKMDQQGKVYQVMIRPLKKLKIGEEVLLAGKMTASLIDKEGMTVCFSRKITKRYLDEFGHMPLPPYIKRKDEHSDKNDYQTVYAKKDGSVASPTAGLHFSKGLMSTLGWKFKMHSVTLHVNYATFKPVEVENITEHKMHYEDYSIIQKTFASLCRAKSKGEHIVAVGTTAARVLESVTQTRQFSGTTNLFIYPGFEFKMVDVLITNFHLPFSTLLMLVCAFAGKNLAMAAYQEAIKEKYRFYSYGDGMILL